MPRSEQKFVKGTLVEVMALGRPGPILGKVRWTHYETDEYDVELKGGLVSRRVPRSRLRPVDLSTLDGVEGFLEG